MNDIGDTIESIDEDEQVIFAQVMEKFIKNRIKRMKSEQGNEEYKLFEKTYEKNVDRDAKFRLLKAYNSDPSIFLGGN